MPVLRNNGFEYAYVRRGDPEAPAVLLLMGLGMPKEAWPEALVRGLLERGFQVVAPDNRDAGASSRMSAWRPGPGDVMRAITRAVLGLPVVGEYALEDMALDAERLLDALGIRRAHVAGVSMGGMIAQVLAVQCPNRVATLTSISSASGNPRTGLGRPSAIWSVLSQGRRGDPRARVLSVLRTLAGPAYPVDEVEADTLFEALPLFDIELDAVFRQVIALLASGNRSAQLENLRVPTFVVHGSSDPLLPPAAGEEMARLIAGARLWMVEGLGHQLPPALMPELAARIAAHASRHPA